MNYIVLKFFVELHIKKAISSKQKKKWSLNFGGWFVIRLPITVKFWRYLEYFKNSYGILEFALDLHKDVFGGMFLRALKQVLVLHIWKGVWYGEH